MDGLFLEADGGAPKWLIDQVEKVVALVIDHDECGEVLNLDLPHRLHTQLGVFQDFNFGDAVLGQSSGRSTNRTQIETTVLLAGIGDGL